MPSILSNHARRSRPRASFGLCFRCSNTRVCSAPLLGQASPGAGLDGRASLKVLAMTVRHIRLPVARDESGSIRLEIRSLPWSSMIGSSGFRCNRVVHFVRCTGRAYRRRRVSHRTLQWCSRNARKCSNTAHRSASSSPGRCASFRSSRRLDPRVANRARQIGPHATELTGEAGEAFFFCAMTRDATGRLRLLAAESRAEQNLRQDGESPTVVLARASTTSSFRRCARRHRRRAT